ncbi:hypothetical protein P3G55_05110 [Leptospira sp. 96542]|nr:hypothetical protein [Leptospira sp. 96542]
MSDTIHDSKLPKDKKEILLQIIQTMLNDVNTKITHLGINNYIKIQEDVAKLIVPVLEDKLD